MTIYTIKISTRVLIFKKMIKKYQSSTQITTDVLEKSFKFSTLNQKNVKL